MALTRPMLRNLGITEKETLDAIMDAHGDTITPLKDSIRDLEADKTKLEQDIKNAPKSDVTGDGEDWKAKYDAEVTAHKATVTTHETEKKTAAVTSLAEKKLIESGCNPKAAKFIIKELPLDKLKEDGSNWDDIHKPVKEANADFYGEVRTEGAAVGTPPGGSESVGGMKTLTQTTQSLNAHRITK